MPGPYIHDAEAANRVPVKNMVHTDPQLAVDSFTSSYRLLILQQISPQVHLVELLQPAKLRENEDLEVMLVLLLLLLLLVVLLLMLTLLVQLDFGEGGMGVGPLEDGTGRLLIVLRVDEVLEANAMIPIDMFPSIMTAVDMFPCVTAAIDMFSFRCWRRTR